MPSAKMSVTSWFLVSGSGTRHRLPREMIFVGREDCEFMLQSRSVDKQHAVINYDAEKDEHWVKDLGSINGTFVNDIRIPDQKYVALRMNDVVRFGYDSNVYVLEKIQHKVPEEALKHEKYTSQLQMSLKGTDIKRAEQHVEPCTNIESPRARLEKAERKAVTDVPSQYRTPLYGQPSWWGEDDAGNKIEREHIRSPEDHYSDHPKHEQEINGNIVDYKDPQEQSVYSYRREPSYFEIPTKEFQQPTKSPEKELQEIPTKDIDTITPPVVQSHASFTIEFDECVPGKMKIKDQVTKFSYRPRKLLGKDPSQAEMISAESKVADWLVQNDPSLLRRQPKGDDIYSTKSDLQVHISTLKGSRHEDGTQSDSEDPAVTKPQQQSPDQEHLDDAASMQLQIQPDPLEVPHNQQAFVIEFVEDNPRKKRSQSFTQSAYSAHSDSCPVHRGRRKGAVAPDKPGSTAPQVLQSSQGSHGSRPVTVTTSMQRSSSLKREKTEERLSTASGSNTRTAVKSFGSIGRKSRIAQEFAKEFLRDTIRNGVVSAEKPSLSNELRMPAQISQVMSVPLPVSSSILTPAVTVTAVQHSNLKSSRNDKEEDNLSETGTYTIETDSQDREVEEARKMIDQVFGILESPEYNAVSTAVYRPVIGEEKERSHSNQQVKKDKAISQKTTLAQTYSSLPTGCPQNITQAQPVSPVIHGGQKWASMWASLADSYSDVKSSSGMQEKQISEGNGGFSQVTASGKAVEVAEPGTNVSSRTRRILPQIPPTDKSETTAAVIAVTQETFSSYSISSLSQTNDIKHGRTERQDTANRLIIQEDLDPDSLSDDSKSDDGLAVERSKKHKHLSSTERPKQDKTRKDLKTDEQLKVSRATNGRVADEAGLTCYTDIEKMEMGSPSKRLLNVNHENKDFTRVMTNAHSTKQVDVQNVNRTFSKSTGKPVGELSKNFSQDPDNIPTKDPSTYLIRQESFTKERPSRDVPVSMLPHISSCTVDYSHDTQHILKETETALAALEAKFRSQTQSVENNRTEDSLSGESDVDTASTVSLLSGKNAALNEKRVLNSNLQKEKSSSTPSIQDQCNQSGALGRLSEKRRTQTSDTSTKGEQTKRFHLKRSAGTHGSTDLTDDEKCSSLPHIPVTETATSDYEQPMSRPLSRKKPFSQSTKESSKSVVQQGLTRSNSLSAPRPTRTSRLRRSRLEASDNECADSDKVSIHAEQSSASSAPSKQPAEVKKLSRIDILAMPRKRAGSFNVPSDSETTALKSGFSGRSIELSTTIRKPVIAVPRRSPGQVVKQTVSHTRSTSTKFSTSSSSRRRQQGSDYTSTSEEEYGSNHSSPKHKHSHTSTVTQTSRTQPSGYGRKKQSQREAEEDDDEAYPYQNWISQTAEIAEIARLSQNLVKDVASLAREISDVAGDGDSQSSSGTGPSTSTSSVPNTPASTISAREELVQHIPEASLNFQKLPPGSTGLEKILDQNMNDQEVPRRTRNREEMIFDNLMLNPVSQLSHAIRENTEQLAEKMKILFQNTEKNWEEIEAKINSENDVPILKTSNREISSILKELRRVQKQLEVINSIIDVTGPPHVLAGKTSSPGNGQSAHLNGKLSNTASPLRSSRSSPTKLLSSVPPQQKPGSPYPGQANFNPNEDDESFVV
ncbi:centrosomal protein of 170 kDa protein B [Protopterus annectens]|uniref:centrosomal protein of 170 kDa protein B n=1 Tax=Protopterus annectens TaxID=7888 RepID=UPI001CF961ED|nr:centrosomal protein of 170 kDa protein B [Protopterus annectens]